MLSWIIHLNQAAGVIGASFFTQRNHDGIGPLNGDPVCYRIVLSICGIRIGHKVGIGCMGHFVEKIRRRRLVIPDIAGCVRYCDSRIGIQLMPR
jgi:hypothetical protein